MGPERLVIGRFCAIASGVRFVMPATNHADRGPATFRFEVFGPSWDATMDIVLTRSWPAARRVVRLRFSEEQMERLLRANSFTADTRRIMTGTAAELDHIAAEHGRQRR